MPPKVIDLFRGPHRFLSNFQEAEVEFEGVVYPTTEHAYQAAKTLIPVERQYIAQLTTPGEAKRAGRKVTKRPDWEQVNLAIMEGLNYQKFSQYPHLRAKLLATGDAELIEGNTWGDIFWGVCRGVGLNHLGRILMRVRDRVRKEDAA